MQRGFETTLYSNAQDFLQNHAHVVLLLLCVLCILLHRVLRYLQDDADEDDLDDDFDIHGMLGSAGAEGEDRSAPTAEERRRRLNRRLQEKEAARLQDQVPGNLFRAPMMADATVLAPQPVALKTAMK